MGNVTISQYLKRKGNRYGIMNFLGLKEFDIIRSESNDNGDVV